MPNRSNRLPANSDMNAPSNAPGKMTRPETVALYPKTCCTKMGMMTEHPIRPPCMKPTVKMATE